MNQNFLDQWNEFPIAAKVAIVLFCWSLASAYYYFVYYEEQTRTYSSLFRQFAQKRKERTKYETIAQNLSLWQDEVRRLKEERAKARTLLPTDKEIPSLLQKIDNLANKSGLEIESFQPRRERKKPYYAEVPMTMRVSGTFYELMVFFDKISHLDRIVNVSNFQLVSPSMRNQKLVVRSTFQLVTYRYMSKLKK